ncbi:LysM peptidoglycan-binding domain-containing protein [Chlamydia gallinacea]|uniref:Peptidase M23 n=2 Tax=Chlamydia gallinacea TaxID=1457153 RepID=A0A173DYN9_9CHLA|nr:LysM peptidoglycan-binding domain-containing protein [Chlamydia gallinacea]EYE60648.1 lysM domain protein [Bacteroides fragilis str. S6L5]ANG66041.1 peptidase M23 [Chlamydia gallinacea 08-1274/3]AQT77734.1 peptidase M23 [Chlamydia gallinacea]MBX6680048.1 LysM peptidoglycan-binding domain-containing protein [Chlamydia gallinacea]MBX6687280.1 LysM peptidoglycan-binding domain-containing protein [Chlamydia gallinacea]
MDVNKISSLFLGVFFAILGTTPGCAAGKSPSLQTLLAEIEDTSAKLLCYESEMQILVERLDEQDSKIQQLESIQPEVIARKIKQLETEQKTLAKTLSILTTSVKDIQSALQQKLEVIQKDYKTLSQDIRLLRQSLLALVDGSSETYPDFSEAIPSHIHIVQPGENLGKIATKYKISVEELKKLNKLSSDVIYVNQRLCLPKNKK